MATEKGFNALAQASLPESVDPYHQGSALPTGSPGTVPTCQHQHIRDSSWAYRFGRGMCGPLDQGTPRHCTKPRAKTTLQTSCFLSFFFWLLTHLSHHSGDLQLCSFPHSPPFQNPQRYNILWFSPSFPLPITKCKSVTCNAVTAPNNLLHLQCLPFSSHLLYYNLITFLKCRYVMCSE